MSYIAYMAYIAYVAYNLFHRNSIQWHPLTRVPLLLIKTPQFFPNKDFYTFVWKIKEYFMAILLP